MVHKDMFPDGTTETKQVVSESQHTESQVITNGIYPDFPQADINIWWEGLLNKKVSSVINNIYGCRPLSRVTRASLGPHGINKIVIHDEEEKLFLNELEIEHPAAKVLLLAGKEQQKKFGDGAKLVVSIAGQHLEGAKELIEMGVDLSEVINGYRKASNKVGEILEGLVEEGSENMDVRDKDEVILRMKAPVASKQYKNVDFFCPLIAEACIEVCPENPLNFNVGNVRVAKLLFGKPPCYSHTFKGMVLKAVGSIKRIKKARVVVIAGGGVDSVLIQSDEQQLENYAKNKEAKVEKLIKAVAESGARVIVSGAAVGEMALHLCERYNIMVFKLDSESEVGLFRRTTNAVVPLKLGSTVDPCYLGYADSIIFEKNHGARVYTTPAYLGSDEVERAVDVGVYTYKTLCKDSRIVPGAGATEIEIATKLKEYSLTETGSDKRAIAKYARSFEMIPRILSENAYLDTTDIISTLYKEHTSGNVKVGIDLEEGTCKDASTLKIWDLYTTKYHALQYAADVVCRILGAYQTSTVVDKGDSGDGVCKK